MARTLVLAQKRDISERDGVSLHVWAGGGMAYTFDLKSNARKGLRVQPPPGLLRRTLSYTSNLSINDCSNHIQILLRTRRFEVTQT